jgi:hypothetical protein
VRDRLVTFKQATKHATYPANFRRLLAEQGVEEWSGDD